VLVVHIQQKKLPRLDVYRFGRLTIDPVWDGGKRAALQANEITVACFHANRSSVLGFSPRQTGAENLCKMKMTGADGGRFFQTYEPANTPYNLRPHYGLIGQSPATEA
jgi:hypothetical protein